MQTNFKPGDIIFFEYAEVFGIVLDPSDKRDWPSWLMFNFEANTNKIAVKWSDGDLTIEFQNIERVGFEMEFVLVKSKQELLFLSLKHNIKGSYENLFV